MPVTVTIDFVGLFMLAVHDRQLHVLLPTPHMHAGMPEHVAAVRVGATGRLESIDHAELAVYARGARAVDETAPDAPALPKELIHMCDLATRPIPHSAIGGPPHASLHTRARLAFDTARTPLELSALRTACYKVPDRAGTHGPPRTAVIATRATLRGLPAGEAFARAFHLKGTSHPPKEPTRPFDLAIPAPNDGDTVALHFFHAPQDEITGNPTPSRPGMPVAHFESYYLPHGMAHGPVPIFSGRNDLADAPPALVPAKVMGSTETCPNCSTCVG